MTLREDLLDLVETLEEIPGPTGCDIRQNAVFVEKWSWDGGQAFLGNLTVTVLCELLPRPRTNQTVDGRELVVEPVIPKHPKGGLDWDVLNPSPAANEVVVYRVEGPNQGYYVLYNIESSRPFRYVLTLRVLDRDYPRPVG
ncbi:hypothetical protein KKA53_05200 [Candidatus Dependentiae bacterium]|nr:hypothetical protein [Candidatus Dependentiae bacterium]